MLDDDDEYDAERPPLRPSYWGWKLREEFFSHEETLSRVDQGDLDGAIEAIAKEQGCAPEALEVWESERGYLTKNAALLTSSGQMQLFRDL